MIFTFNHKRFEHNRNNKHYYFSYMNMAKQNTQYHRFRDPRLPYTHPSSSWQCHNRHYLLHDYWWLFRSAWDVAYIYVKIALSIIKTTSIIHEYGYTEHTISSLSRSPSSAYSSKFLRWSYMSFITQIVGWMEDLKHSSINQQIVVRVSFVISLSDVFFMQ